jgi:peptide/nickel transport system ATP-binding protein
VSALLVVEDLRVQFSTQHGVVHAVDWLSWSVEPGKTLAIVGGPGAGKTVTSLALLGLTPDASARISGRVLFEGRDLLGLAGAELRRIRGDQIGMVVQDPVSSLHPFQKVGTQLIETILAHRQVSRAAARDRAIDLLEVVRLPDPHHSVDQYPDELSLSIRRRATIALALANEPELLIADEPTSGLDLTVQAEILELLKRIQERLGMAIIMVCRDVALAAQLADQICVMYAGRIVERGPTDLILGSPQHPYTWSLLSSIPKRETLHGAEVEPNPGRPPSLIHRPPGCLFHPRCPFVRDEHRRVDPPLQPVPGQSGHEVACLLEPEVRSAIWHGLKAGEEPAALRRLAQLGPPVRASGALPPAQGGGS